MRKSKKADWGRASKKRTTGFRGEIREKDIARYKKAMKEHLERKPDMTLEELRDATGLACTLPAIHYALASMELTYKKRRSAPASKTEPTSSRPARNGAGSNAGSTLRGLSSSTKAGPKPT